MLALLLVALIVAVLVLCSRLHEANAQLKQVRHERDVYAQLHEEHLWDLYCSTMPKNYIEVPERREQ